MGHDLEVGLRLTGRRDSSLKRSLDETSKGLKKLGSESRQSSAISVTSASKQSRATEKNSRKTQKLTRTYRNSIQAVSAWGRKIKSSTGSLKNQRREIALLDKGLDKVGNRYTGLIGGIGAGVTVKNVGNAQERLERLGIQAGYSSEKVKKLKRDIEGAALEKDIRVDPKQILSGVEAIVEKTGNLKFAEQNLKNIGIAMQATGATGEDIGELFGEFEKMGIKSPKKVAEAIDILNVQGKSGAFTLQNLASLGPRVITAYTSTGREGTKALREMGSALQMIRMGTGSSEQSATAFEAVLRSLTDPKKIEKLEAMGIELFDPQEAAKGKRVMRPINQLMKEIIKTTSGDKVELGQVFDAEAVRAFNQAAGEFQRTGSLQKLDEFYNVQADGSTTLKDAARASKTFNASLTMIDGAWERFAETRLTKPIEFAAGALDKLGSKGADRLFSGLTIAGGGLATALAARKGVRLYRGAKNFFGKGHKKLSPKNKRFGNTKSLLNTDGVQDVRVVNLSELNCPETDDTIRSELI